MKSIVNDISLKKLLTFIIFLTTLITSIFGIVILVFFNISYFEKELIDKHLLFTRMVGDECQIGLEFNYIEDIERKMESFELLNSVLYSEISNNSNDSLLSYYSDNYVAKEKYILDNDTVFTRNNIIHINHNIINKGNKLGKLYIQVSKNELNEKIENLIYYFLIVEIILLLIAYFVGKQLQKIVSGPILKLANVSKQISNSKDYSIQLNDDGENEIGMLYKSFNQMIKSINDYNKQKDAITLELGRAQERLTAIGKALPDFVYIIDEDGDILDILNSELKLERKYIKNTLDKNQSSLIYETIKNTINTKQSQSVIFYVVFKKQKKWYEGRTSYLKFKASNGKRIIVFVSRDITARRIAELRLQEVNNNLEGLVGTRTKELIDSNKSLMFEIEERKSTALALSETKEELVEALRAEKKSHQMKSNFISLISHEYKTPLTVMLITTSILKNYFEMGDKEKFDKSLKQIENSINDITLMIDDVLFLGKVMSNEIKPAISEFNIMNILEASVTRAKQVDNFAHPIKLISNSNNATVLSDIDMFSKAIDGILSNATKFSPKDKEITISLEDDDDSISVAIEDLGNGMTKDVVNQIFEPFYKYEKDIGLVKGTGMGLAIVKNCISIIRGEIDVQSSVGIGTKFIITIPKQLS